MTGPLLHAPTAPGIVRAVFWIAISTGLDLGGCLLFGYPPRLRRQFWLLVVVFGLQAVTRDDIGGLLSVLYVVWVLCGRDLPWDRLGRRLKSAVVSLTDVAAAPLRREQSEAWSASSLGFYQESIQSHVVRSAVK